MGIMGGIITVRITSVLSLYVLISTTVTASNFISIRQQSSDGNATFSLIDSEDGSTVATSSLSFAYNRPLVEVTATDDSNFYVVSFPSDDPNGATHLWELSSKLAVKKQWTQPKGGLEFFDLQYSSLQSELFGIAVNGTYGRVISRLDTSGDEVIADFIVACPYMWYVNASTFDHKNDQYYGLLNNFKDPSLGQKLIVVNVNDGSSVVYKYDPTLSDTLLYYITFTTKGIFAMGANDAGVAELGMLHFNDNHDDDGSIGPDDDSKIRPSVPLDPDSGPVLSDDDNKLDDANRGDDDDDTEVVATFESLLTFDSSLGKYSPIFQSSSTSEDEQVCLTLGNIETSPQLECYTIQGGQLTQPLDITPSRDGNVAAVACYV